MANNERVDRAHVRANRAFEGELVFEGEWVPPTPFNGIAFLASGVVLRHLHRRTQARENGTQNANRRGRGDTERRPWWRRRRLGNRAPDDEYENENGNNRPRPRWTAAENVVGDDPRGRFVAGIPHSREEGSNDAREGVEGTHGGTRSVVRRSESEDDLMRLAATSREAHLRHVAAAMAARDGGDGARAVEVPRTEVPPRDVGDVASVSPASSAPLAEVESLPEPARSQIEFFRRLSVESARPEEDGRGTIATEGGGAEGGAEVSQLCATGGADAQLCATVPPSHLPDPDEPEQRTCRFCLGGEDEGAAGDDALIAPCRCRGTQGWVHHGCLREWQRVSVSSTGRVERRCRVCHSAFRTPRPPIKDVIKEWFNPTATDRLQCYRRAWWQMLSNSIMAQEGVEHIGTANQLVRLFLATELRVWGGREVRGGNGTLRAVANAARLATNAHSVVLLTWLASIGAAHVGDRIARHDEETDADAAAARALDDMIRPRNPARGGGVGVDGGGSRGWNGKMEKIVKALDAARRAVGGPLGWLVRFAVPSTTTAMRLADPIQGAISFFERYPQYRVV